MNLRDIRDYVAQLGIAEDERCYCAKMPDKKERSIGIYPQKHGQPFKVPLGGMASASYGTKAVSLLVHWNKSPGETEQAAADLQKALAGCRESRVHGWNIKFIMLSHEEPVPVGTDDGGIYEYVLEAQVYYEEIDEEKGGSYEDENGRVPSV